MKTPQGKEQLLSQFKSILEGVDKTADKVKSDFDFEKANLEKQSGALNTLVEQQRNYFKTVKQFQEECVKNEQLMAMMQEAEQQQGADEEQQE
jgi:gas vesicle protein